MFGNRRQSLARSIIAKTILSSYGKPDPWFGITYSMNLYRGCAHGCVYCDSRSLCYGIDDFSEILVKENAIELLRDELRRKRKKGTIGTGSMNDPYQPIERSRRLTRRALEAIAERRFPAHALTKSDLALRDIDLWQRIGETYGAVSFSTITPDDDLARKIEPGAPSPTERFKAMEQLAINKIYTGVLVMPILPYLTDDADQIRDLLNRAADAGAQYAIPAFGMTLRDRQRAYFYDKLDLLFPGVRERYERTYGDRYEAHAPNSRELERVFNETAERLGLPTKMRFYEDGLPEQISLF
jgi:DNA repair photolyase